MAPKSYDSFQRALNLFSPETLIWPCVNHSYHLFLFECVSRYGANRQISPPTFYCIHMSSSIRLGKINLHVKKALC